MTLPISRRGGSIRIASTRNAALMLVCLCGALAGAQQPRDTTTKFEIYGFAQGDMIFDARRTDPNWFDVNRPTKLPSFGTEFNANGNTYFSARQTRFGVKATRETDHGNLIANFDFDLFGVGVDAGQTTIRLRHAYGQWGQFGAGQLESPFMDLDVFPNILDYWGPNGMLFFRNVQVFWRPIDHEGTQLTFALERPGASGDAGQLSDRISIANVKPRFPYPDFSAGYRYAGKWGYVKVAGIWRSIHWEQIPTDSFDISGHATGLGGSLSSNIKIGKRGDVLRLQAVYGHGIENYFNDAPVDVALEADSANRRSPVKGKALPIFGGVAYFDHNWNSKWTSSLGWSMVDIDNSDLQAANAFRNGQYASANVLTTPIPNVMMGVELQYGRRANFADEFSFDDFRVQFSFKYSFAKTFGGKT
jgi:hypothetical protein